MWMHLVEGETQTGVARILGLDSYCVGRTLRTFRGLVGPYLQMKSRFVPWQISVLGITLLFDLWVYLVVCGSLSKTPDSASGLIGEPRY